MNLDPYNLARHARKWHSMHGEDGITLALCNRLQPPRSFLEIGCAVAPDAPLENNCIILAKMDWDGIWVDKDADGVARLAAAYPPCVEGHPDTRRVYIGEAVTRENAHYLNVPGPLGVFSLDIDGNDYHVWDALDIQPYIAIVEVNTERPADVEYVMPYDPGYVSTPGHTNYGASLASMIELGKRKGMTFVCMAPPSVNAFFVRDDLVSRLE